jgi:lipopolysaccharide transport system permease protein
MIDHVKAVWQFRHFWLSLVRLDLQNRYRRSVLGIGWSLLNPIAMTAVFCTVFSGVIPNTDWKIYAPFLLAGVTVWDFVKGSMIQGCDSFVRAEAYIRQCPMPYTIYPLRTVLGTFIHFVIAMGVLVVTVPVTRNWGLPAGEYAAAVWADLAGLVVGVGPAVVGAMLLTALFAWGVATIAAFAHVYFHDTKHLLEVATQMFFFLTPIIYQRSALDDRGLGWLADINPVTTFLELIRTPLLTGVPPTSELYTQGAVLAATSVGLAWGKMVWLQKKVVFQL